MKKLTCKVITAAMACTMLLLCSCGKRKNVTPPNATLTLALRSGTFGNVIKKIIPEFEAENNVVCTILELEEDVLHQKVANDAVIAEGSYDLCMVDGSWMAEYTAKHVLANLNELGFELDDDIISATKTISYYKGGLYLVPFGGNVTVLLYNKLFVKEAGYTPEEITSLDDMLKICEFTQKRHNLGFLYRGDTANNTVVDFLPILRSFGGWVVDENNNPTIDTPVFAEAMKFYMQLVKTGRTAKKDDLVAAIANKAAALGIGWPGWYTPTNNSSMDYIALTGKQTRESPAFNANVYGIWTLGIPANSQNKEYAIKLLKLITSPETQKKSITDGGVPCRYSSLKDPEVLARYPQYEAVRRALESGIYRPVMEEWTRFYTILGKEMTSILKGEKSVETGLSDAQKQIELMLKSAKED